MNHTASANSVKKNTENQSIAEPVLRRRVGSANAASTATPGRPSSSARSEPPMTRQATSPVTSTVSGIARWRRIKW